MNLSKSFRLKTLKIFSSKRKSIKKMTGNNHNIILIIAVHQRGKEDGKAMQAKLNLDLGNNKFFFCIIDMRKVGSENFYIVIHCYNFFNNFYFVSKNSFFTSNFFFDTGKQEVQEVSMCELNFGEVKKLHQEMGRSVRFSVLIQSKILKKIQ